MYRVDGTFGVHRQLPAGSTLPSRFGSALVPAALLTGALLFLGLPLQSPAVSHSGSRPAQNPTAEPAVDAATSLWEQNRFADAERAFARLADAARLRGDKKAEVRALLYVGGCQVSLFSYREALRTYLRVRHLAEELADRKLQGAASLNLSSVYSQLNNVAQAEQEASRAVLFLEGADDPVALSKALMQVGSLRMSENDASKATAAYERAISIAQKNWNKSLEAFAWDHLGEAWLAEKKLEPAERALTEAYRLRLFIRDPQLNITRAKLAELEFFKGNAASALRRLDAILGSSPSALATIPQYQIAYRRAQMLAALSRYDEALTAFRKAVRLAKRWRESALPGEATEQSTTALLHSVYADAADMAAQLSLRRHDPQLAREALVIIATNRAADLREQRALARLEANRLPPRYYALLKELRSAESGAILANSEADQANVGRIRAELNGIETELGIENEISVGGEESFRPQKTLTNIQRNLKEDDVLLSFNTGATRSWLWAVTRRSVLLRELGPEPQLEQLASVWKDRIRAGDKGSAEGAQLSRALFGQLPTSIIEKRNWLMVSGDRLLLGIPIPALPLRGGEMRAVHQSEAPVIAGHSVRHLVSEFSLVAAKSLSAGLEFLGIGDPIYNLADPRLVRLSSFRRASANRNGSTALGRLVGSGLEIRSAASVFARFRLLTGSEANPGTLQDALDAYPSVLHFAVHVISPDKHPDDAALALSLGDNQLPALLTPEVIAKYRVPGSLVVLSGCDSEQSKPVPGVGWTGLGRAWLVAGASAVIVSAWPTPDDAGRFFQSFYHRLNAEPASESMAQRAATALAATQNQMRHEDGYRRSPSFWAAYTVLSKE